MKILNILFFPFMFGTIFCQLNANIDPIVDELTNEHLPAIVHFIEYCFTDPIEGKLRSITYPVQSLKRAVNEGFSFDGSSILGFTPITESDLQLKADLNTITGVLPWTRDGSSTARVITNIYQTNNKRFFGDPRFILQQQLERAQSMGYEFLVGTELEFYMFNGETKNPIDQREYFDATSSFMQQNDIAALFSVFGQMGIEVEKFHHEVGPGQYEISLRYDNALKMADMIMLAKHTLKQFGDHMKTPISFMPKPFSDHNGSGMHIHFSLYDKEHNTNLFYDAQNELQLSALGKSFIAGVLHRIAEVSLLFNSSINSYKRLVPGFEAPIFICCGQKNRSALIRLPHAPNAHAVRAELRSPDALCNPYLAFAALLKAGLEGITNGLTLAQIITENLYELEHQQVLDAKITMLPTSFEQALHLFEQSEFAQELLGQKLFEEIISFKKEELQEYNTTITEWELKRYL